MQPPVQVDELHAVHLPLRLRPPPSLLQDEVTTDPKPQTPNPQPQTPNPKPETRNPKPQPPTLFCSLQDDAHQPSSIHSCLLRHRCNRTLLHAFSFSALSPPRSSHPSSHFIFITFIPPSSSPSFLHRCRRISLHSPRCSYRRLHMDQAKQTLARRLITATSVTDFRCDHACWCECVAAA